jgi:O-antigen/teichoic acid export membrane protein
MARRLREPRRARTVRAAHAGQVRGAGLKTSAAEGGTALGAETKKFGRNALLYLVPSLLMRGISFLLTPLYTRAMAPADFAVVAVSNSLVAVLGIVLGLALYGCVPRLFFEYEERAKRAFFGTLLATSLVVPLAIVGVLHLLGARGHLEMFETLHFDPHLKLVLWTSLTAVFMPLPISVYTTREEPGKVAALSMFSALSQLILSVLFVAVWRQGAVGVLRANLVSGALTGGVSIVLMLRLSTIDPRLPGLRSALAFSLPLVPHLVANWALGISDRLVLDHYVPAADVGRYSLGYVFGLIVALIASSVGNALGPMANRQLKDEKLAANVPPLGTYALAFIVACALGIALTSPEIIALIAPASYASAAAVVPWVVLGAVFQGGYFVLSTGTWFSMKTKLVPVITAVSACLNVGLNLLFVPRYGVMAAAISTAVSYLASALLHGVLAHKLHPIRWEYGRWARLLGVGLACYFVGVIIPASGPVLALASKGLVVVILFPLGLRIARFFTSEELLHLRAVLERRLLRT